MLLLLLLQSLGRTIANSESSNITLTETMNYIETDCFLPCCCQFFSPSLTQWRMYSFFMHLFHMESIISTLKITDFFLFLSHLNRLINTHINARTHTHELFQRFFLTSIFYCPFKYSQEHFILHERSTYTSQLVVLSLSIPSSHCRSHQVPIAQYCTCSNKVNEVGYKEHWTLIRLDLFH